jgi:hypothetical protein
MHTIMLHVFMLVVRTPDRYSLHTVWVMPPAAAESQSSPSIIEQPQ